MSDDLYSKPSTINQGGGDGVVCSDDDLERLKELISWREGDSCYSLPWEKLEALIARVEASEDRFNYGHNDDSGTMSACIRPCKACAAEKAWRKVSGH